MNRPKLEEYWSSGLVFHESDYEDFIEDLEKYCDELESKLELAIGTNDILNDRINVFEKALDKACEELARDGKMVGMTNDFIMYSRKATKEEWKEYLLNAE